MQEALEETTRAFYRRSLHVLKNGGVPFLIGGAYALARYTGIERHTKDLDIFVCGKDLERALAVLEEAGYPSELTFPHWLGKARCGDDLVDVIHSSGNAIAAVDDEWFVHAVDDEVLGVPVQLCPPEEMIWSKAFIMERERYDGADVMHLLRACGQRIDWTRLLRRFGPHYRVLLSHLVLFGFIYPGARDVIPLAVMDDLLGLLHEELASEPPDTRVCRGTLLSRAQYLIDVHEWGCEDARHDPSIPMTPEHIAQWTQAISADLLARNEEKRATGSGR